MIELILVKQGGVLMPATDADKDNLSDIVNGDPFRAELYQQRDRSLKHHRLFYGGLVELAMQYYQPSDSLVTDYDRGLVKATLKAVGVDKLGKDTANQVYRAVIDSVQRKRETHVELQPIGKEAFVTWLKFQAGHYENIQLPDGSILKQPKSINFQSMSQDKFDAFFKECFRVCWQLVLRHNFPSEEEAQRVIEQLSMMG